MMLKIVLTSAEFKSSSRAHKYGFDHNNLIDKLHKTYEGRLCERIRKHWFPAMGTVPSTSQSRSSLCSRNELQCPCSCNHNVKRLVGVWDRWKTRGLNEGFNVSRMSADPAKLCARSKSVKVGRQDGNTETRNEWTKETMGVY